MGSIRVYTCFDACGSKNPAKTDLKYYFLLRAWSGRAPLAGTVVDVHGIASNRTVGDLREELSRRLRNSDVLLLIVSERTASSEGWISWEIDFASEHCGLPIVCAYTGRDGFEGEAGKDLWWPSVLRRIVYDRQARAIHVPFRPHALASAFSRAVWRPL